MVSVFTYFGKNVRFFTGQQRKTAFALECCETNGFMCNNRKKSSSEQTKELIILIARKKNMWMGGLVCVYAVKLYYSFLSTDLNRNDECPRYALHWALFHSESDSTSVFCSLYYARHIEVQCRIKLLTEWKLIWPIHLLFVSLFRQDNLDFNNNTQRKNHRNNK